MRGSSAATRTITERFADKAPTTPRVVYRLCDAEACIAFEGNHCQRSSWRHQYHD